MLAYVDKRFSSKAYCISGFFLLFCWIGSTALSIFSVAQCIHTYYANYTIVPNVPCLLSATLMLLIGQRNSLRGKISCLNKTQYTHYASVCGCLIALSLTIPNFICKRRSKVCTALTQHSCQDRYLSSSWWYAPEEAKLRAITQWVNISILLLVLLEMFTICFCILIIHRDKDYTNANAGCYGGYPFYQAEIPCSVSAGIECSTTKDVGTNSQVEPGIPPINIDILNENQANAASNGSGSKDSTNSSSDNPSDIPVLAPPGFKPNMTSMNPAAKLAPINIKIHNLNKADAEADVKQEAERKKMLSLLKDIKKDVSSLSSSSMNQGAGRSPSNSTSIDIELPPNNTNKYVPYAKQPSIPQQKPQPQPSSTPYPEIGFKTYF